MKAIRRILFTVGYDRQLERPCQMDFNQILSKLMAKTASRGQNPVIFDVGSHIGQSLIKYKELFPNANIHCFEPDIETFQELKSMTTQQKELRDAVLNNTALGADTGRKPFHRNARSQTSGFNRVNIQSKWCKTRSWQYSTTPEKFNSATFDVNIRTMDDYILEHRIDRVHFVKIDTQGFEDEVLKGAQQALRQNRIDIIQTEVIVGDAYVKSLKFMDIEQLICPWGYEFVAINHSGNRLEKPQLQFDLIYCRKELLTSP